MDSTKTRANEASCSPSSSKRWKYEVFLSFRGEDTRKGFTDHLHLQLKDQKVNVFIDEKEVQRGENLTDELKQAIEGSRISVVVFSRGYADSRWCLEELEKMMSCRTTVGQTVLPIFYDVEPSDVRKQTGCFAEAFEKHEERFHQVKDMEEKIQLWRKALTEAADLAGMVFSSTDGYEGKFIRDIVNVITGKLYDTYLKVATYEIGIDSRVKDISDDLQVGGLDDVRIIGILGMVGAGKTTVAKAIFNRFHHLFDGKSFLQNVREKDMVKLQNQLIKDILRPAKLEVSDIAQGTKVIEDRLGNLRLLLIIDDVDRVEQLDALAVKRVSFAPGSRIIITTRNEHFLNILRVDKTRVAQTMNEEEALELLSWHAFNKSTPDEGYLQLSREVVVYCRGLPLALQVLGSHLCTKSTSEWRSALDKFKRLPHGDLQRKLKVSYDGLADDRAKAIFLDISCFFIGMNKDFAMSFFDACGLYPTIGIGKLHEQCLVTVDKEGNLMMHDLIRDMGREIICAESPMKPERRSRLWHHEDIKGVLRKESGTNKIEGLALDFLDADNASFRTKAFKKMKGLRLLKLKGVKFTGRWTHLSKDLRWLCWRKFPLYFIPEDFNQPNLIDMDLSHSKITVWEDSDLSLEKLRFLNLGYCNHLKRSPDFSKLPNLEKLTLESCKSLSEIRDSIVELKHLQYLSLANCNVTDEAIPKDLGGLSSLKVFDLRGNDFYGLPILIGLPKLQTLQLANCANLQAIPDLPTNLEILEANECTALKRMPDFSGMSRMKELHLNHSPKLTEIPGLDKSLNFMTKIHMERCIELTASFKETIRKGWSTTGKDGGLFLPATDFPLCFRGVDPMNKMVVPHSSEYKEGRTHEAGPAGDLSYENCSHKRLRSGCRVESNAEEKKTDAGGEDSLKRIKVSGDEDITAVKRHIVKSCRETEAIS